MKKQLSSPLDILKTLVSNEPNNTLKNMKYRVTHRKEIRAKQLRELSLLYALEDNDAWENQFR